MENTKIEWASHTFNPWEGCMKVSAGCKNCYAETRAIRYKSSRWGAEASGGTRVVRSEKYWKEPIRWNREASWCGNPVCHETAIFLTGGRCSCGLDVDRPRVFCASLADIFETWSGFMLHSNGDPLHVCSVCGEWRTMENMCHGPTAHMPLRMSDVRKRVFNLIRQTPSLDWLLVTKRIGNVASMMPEYATFGCNELTNEVLRPPAPWPNVWLLTSVEDQAAADYRIAELRKLRGLAAILGLSMEPLLGSVDFDPAGLDWVIVGGESGPGARGCDIRAVRSVVARCRHSGVPVFVKQLGAKPFDPRAADRVPGATTKRCLPLAGDDVTTLAEVLDAMTLNLDDPKGGNMYEWAEDLRVREFPKPSFEQWAFSMNTGA